MNSDESMTMKQSEFMLVVHVLGLASAAPLSARDQTTKKPFVPILMQFYEFRPDGFYSFGYESGDGSFRYESRNTSGHVQGKFGYVDSDGHLRVVEYISGSTGYRVRWENISAPVIYSGHQTTTTSSSAAVPTTSEPQLFTLPVADDADNAIFDGHLHGPVVNGVDHSAGDQPHMAQLSAGPQMMSDGNAAATAPKPVDSSQGDSAQGNGTAPHTNVQAVNGSAIEPFNGSDTAPQTPWHQTAGFVQLQPINGTEQPSLQDGTVFNEMSTTVSTVATLEEMSQQGEGSAVNATGWPDVLHPNGTLEISSNVTNLSFSVITERPEVVDPPGGIHATHLANLFPPIEQQASVDEAGGAIVDSLLAISSIGSSSSAAAVGGAVIDIPPVGALAESTGGTNATPQNADQTDQQGTVLTGSNIQMTTAMNQSVTLQDRVSLLLNHLANKPLVKRIVKLFG